MEGGVPTYQDLSAPEAFPVPGCPGTGRDNPVPSAQSARNG